LGQAYYELGRSNDAIALFENWLKEEPDNPVARHLLIAYQGRPAPDQCASQYIERTFDGFANSFENTLGRLNYCGQLLVQNHLSTLDLPANSLTILDLGCGTGLVGEYLIPYAQKLVGVDLSQAMLDKAVTKQLYHQLHKTDLQEFLLASTDRYDLITCMDTIVYLGRLEEIFALIFTRLNEDGLFIFSTEKISGDHELEYQLNVSGRYSHHPAYLVNLLNNIGFKIEKMHDVNIRKESGCPIIGQFVCTKRAPGRDSSVKISG
jgi:predicted TPR repeat methyltransferase